MVCVLDPRRCDGHAGLQEAPEGQGHRRRRGQDDHDHGNTPQDDVDEQMLDKLDAYIICLNTLSSPVHQTRARYFSWVDPKKGVTGNERVVLGLFDLPKDAAQKCTAGLTKARAMPPKDAKLEAAGDEFARTVMELDGLIDEVFTYYENKNFKDDKFAKGKAMHPRLMAAFANFSKADNNLHETLDGITKPLAAAHPRPHRARGGQEVPLPPQGTCSSRRASSSRPATRSVTTTTSTSRSTTRRSASSTRR